MPKHPSNAVNNDGGKGVPSPDIIRSILDRSENVMPGQRYQDPKIQTRGDVKRPFYFIRPYVPHLTTTGIERKKHSIPLGFLDEITVREAKARKEQIMATVNVGKFVIQSQLSFREVCRRFLETYAPTLGAAAQERYPIQIRNHILPVFADLKLCDINTPMIEHWLRERAKPHETKSLKDGKEITVSSDGLGWWTLSDLRGILSGIFTRAAEWGLWNGRNPCEGVKIGPKKAKRSKQIPDGEDLLRFLAALPDTPMISAHGARLMVITACVAGLRVSEVLGLKPAVIDVHRETLRVERRWRRGDEDEPKSEASKRVRQIGALAGVLIEYAGGRPKHEYVFTRPCGAPLDDRDLQRDVFRPAAEAVGIYHAGFGMHVFRRLNVTWRQQAGATPVEAQKAAGHTSLDMTMLYTQTEDQREREHVGKILERLGISKKPLTPEELQAMKARGGVQ
jgi:integrase